jgi:hypothetical protein
VFPKKPEEILPVFLDAFAPRPCQLNSIQLLPPKIEVVAIVCFVVRNLHQISYTKF